jgi:phosphatidylglycerophosphatase A
MSAGKDQAVVPGGFGIKLFATFFFSGYLPKAPGTWASGFTAIILYFIWPPEWYIQILLIGAVYFIGVWFAGRAEQYFGHDGHRIVIDETAGQMTALFMAPRNPLVYFVAFLLFRVFDIIKPPPARQWESYRGGWGVMADDIAAGAYAAVLLNFFLALLARWGVSYL